MVNTLCLADPAAKPGYAYMDAHIIYI